VVNQDLYRQTLEEMVDLRHPLVVLAGRIPWDELEARVEPLIFRNLRSPRSVPQDDLFGSSLQIACVRGGGRPRLPTRLMLSLLYLKHAFNESDESLCTRWMDSVSWQFFSGQTFYEPRMPCDPTHIGRFRKMIGEEGVQQLLMATIEAAVSSKAVKPCEFEKVIVDSTVMEKAIAHPTDSRLLDIARHQVVKSAKAAGIMLKQTYAKEAQQLRRKAGGYAHARQFKRLRKVVKRQRTILGIVLREVECKLADSHAESFVLQRLTVVMQRAERLRTQKPRDKDKLYAFHAPEVSCIGKGKARKPFEFGVKSSLAITHKQGLIVGARTFPGNPYDGHTLAAQLEQTRIFLENVGTEPKDVFVDLGYRGADHQNPGVTIHHRGKHRSMTKEQRRWLKRRQSIEPVFGHLKNDHRMNRNWLKGEVGDAMHAVLCAAGYNIRWLMRVILVGIISPVYLSLMLGRWIQIFKGRFASLQSESTMDSEMEWRLA
jgi:IS5 family transposase